MISKRGVSHASSPLSSRVHTGSPGCRTWCQAVQLASGKVPGFLPGPRKLGGQEPRI